MQASDSLIRHLLDLCRRADKTGRWCYSFFLSPAEQEDFLRRPESGQWAWEMVCGVQDTERKLLAAGSELICGMPPEPPVEVLLIEPLSEKFSEPLSHRDYLGALLSLGIERNQLGDIVVRDRRAWCYCLSGVSGFIAAGLDRVRRTSVRVLPAGADSPNLAPELVPLSLNVASERLDAVVAAFSGLSRTHASLLFREGAVFVNSRPVSDGSLRLKPGDVFSVRGVGKAVYDGVGHTTKKGRLSVGLRKYT